MGYREQPSLGARCCLPGRPLTPAQGPWRHQHGSCQALRPQSRAHCHRPSQSQDPTQTRKLGPSLSPGPPCPASPLTWTRCPGATGCQRTALIHPPLPWLCCCCLSEDRHFVAECVSDLPEALVSTRSKVLPSRQGGDCGHSGHRKCSATNWLQAGHTPAKISRET